MGKHPFSRIPGMTFTRLVGSGAAASPLAATVNNGRFIAHKDLKIKKAQVVSEAAVTGADTNSVTLKLINLKTDGSGTTAIASLALTSGNNLVQDTPKALTLSATAADLLVQAGEVLTFQETKVGNGMNIAACHLEVEYELQ